MNTNLSVTPYRPSFTAITTVKNPAKILSDADVNLIKSLGAKMGNNKTDTLTIQVTKNKKNPEAAYDFAYDAKSIKKGKYENMNGSKTVPYSKISPADLAKRILNQSVSFFKN